MVTDIIFRYKDHFIIDAYKMVIRVSVPFTEDHYYGKGNGQTRNWLIIVPLSVGVPHIPKV